MAAFLLLTTLLTIAGLIATMVLGFLAGPGHAAQHILLAFVTTIVGLFSQSMTMFFFIGTGKEIKDKSNQDAAVVQQTRAFKSTVFPAAMWALTALMVTFIMGGGVAQGKTPRWLHLTLSAVTLFTFGRAYWIQIQAMHANSKLMERYLAADSAPPEDSERERSAQ
jgi:hypothetical protein